MNLQEDTIVKEPTEKNGSKKNFLWILINFILFTVITGVGVYYGYHTILNKDKVELIIAEIKKKQDVQNEDIKSLQLKLTRSNQVISEIKQGLKENNEDKFGRYYEKLNKKIRRLENSEKNNNTEWIISEVDYLLRIAQYCLYFLNDIKTTISILDKANDRLISENSTDWSDINHKISEKISELNALSVNNHKDLLLKIDKLKSDVKKIILSAEDQSYKIEDKKEPQGITERMWQEFRSIVNIKKHGKKAKLLISEEYRIYLYNYFEQKIKISELAILQLDQKNYIRSLDNIKNNIRIYFTGKKDEERKILDTIDKLKKVRLLPEIPDISHLSDLLNKKLNSYPGKAE